MATFQNNTTKDDYDKSTDETIPYQQQKMVRNGQQRFIIKNDCCLGNGNAQITTTTGPNTNEESSCFKMLQTDGNYLLYNSKLMITDMSNRPVFSLNEYLYKCGVGVAMEVCHPNGLPLCRIVRQGFQASIRNRYKIEVLAVNSQQYPAGITCIGQGMPYRFELTDGRSGQELATIKKNITLLPSGVHGGSEWQLDLPAGLDAENVLLLLGITCAINRLHTEVAKRQTTRNRATAGASAGWS